MRYLPILEIGHQLIQVPLPDVLAIQLAEGFLPKTGDDRTEFFKSCLLSSPPLLFWLHQKWVSERSSESASIPVDEDQLVRELLMVLGTSGHLLIRDNVKPLTSVQRVDIAGFVDAYCFFELRNEKGATLGPKVCARLSVLFRALENDIPQLQNVSVVSGAAGFTTGLNLEAVQRDFDQTDFPGYGQREDLENAWKLDLPFFRNGLQALISVAKKPFFGYPHSRAQRRFWALILANGISRTFFCAHVFSQSSQKFLRIPERAFRAKLRKGLVQKSCYGH